MKYKYSFCQNLLLPRSYNSELVFEKPLPDSEGPLTISQTCLRETAIVPLRHTATKIQVCQLIINRLISSYVFTTKVIVNHKFETKCYTQMKILYIL